MAVKGNTLFTGSYDTTIRVWQKIIRRFVLVSSMIISYVVRHQCWDMSNWNCTARFIGHQSSVEALVVYDNPVNGGLFSGSTDSTVKVCCALSLRCCLPAGEIDTVQISFGTSGRGFSRTATFEALNILCTL